MVNTGALPRTLRGTVLLLATISTSFAASFSYSGAFSADDQVQLFHFTVASPAGAMVTIHSFGYAGGVNSAGATIPAGGFATNLTVFPADGSSILAQDQFGSCTNTNTDPSTGFCLDGFVSVLFNQGDYLLALTQQGNPANGPTFADGFAQAGNPNFTGGPFLDPFGFQRSGDWALDIVGADRSSIDVGAEIPEPATSGLVLSAALLLLAARRKTSRSS